MIEWIGYTVAVGLLLSLAALAAEYAARSRRIASRWAWAAALCMSVVLPIAVTQVVVTVPGVMSSEGVSHSLPLRAMTSPGLTPKAWVPPLVQASSAASAADRASVDIILKRSWIALSVLLLAVLSASAIYLQRRGRAWRHHHLAGTDVLVSDTLGPAVVGWLHPRIVVPRWLLDAPPHQQALVIAHEQAHVAARDPQLLVLCLLLVAVMPWNLPLWWQLRRLRLAIEVDCDARVLGQGHNRQQYGMTLLDVGGRTSGFIGTAAAMAESSSLLEQRIRIIAKAPGQLARRAAPLFAVLALSLTAVAAQVGPPGEHHAIVLEPSAMSAYSGYFQLNEYRVMIITNNGDHLGVNFGTHVVQFKPSSATEFFVPGADVTLVLDQSSARGVSSLRLRQGGVDQIARRVEAPVVEQIDAAIARRREANSAAPGSADILKRNLVQVQGGGQLYMADFAPQTIPLIPQALQRIREQTASLGKVSSIRFVGVGRIGEDHFEVTFEHGKLYWAVLLDSKGKVIEAAPYKI